MNKVVRFILAIVAGIVVVGGVVSGVALLAAQVYPPPPLGPDSRTPVGAVLFVLLAWVAGTIAGGWTARAIAPGGSTLAARTITMVAAVSAVVGARDMPMLPEPLWLRIAAVAAIIVAGFTIPAKRATLS